MAANEGILIKHYVHNCQYLKNNNWLEASREKQLLVAGAVLIVPHWHQQMWLWLTCEEEESLKRKLLCHTNLPLDAGSALMPPGPQSTTRKQSAWFVFTPAFCSHSNFSWFLLWKHSAFIICRFTGCALCRYLFSNNTFWNSDHSLPLVTHTCISCAKEEPACSKAQILVNTHRTSFFSVIGQEWVSKFTPMHFLYFHIEVGGYQYWSSTSAAFSAKLGV